VASGSHLPEPEASVEKETESKRMDDRGLGYAPWIALGALAAGSVGAFVGIARCRNASAARSAVFSDETDSESVTAPHGDKLRGAVI
jgi:hypothetical protein